MHLRADQGSGLLRQGSDPRPCLGQRRLREQTRNCEGARGRALVILGASHRRHRSQGDGCVAPLGETRPNRPRRTHELDITHHPLWRTRCGGHHRLGRPCLLCSLSGLVPLYSHASLAHGQRQLPTRHSRDRRLRWRAATNPRPLGAAAVRSRHRAGGAAPARRSGQPSARGAGVQEQNAGGGSLAGPWNTWIRQASFKGMREDKSAKSVIVETPASPPNL